MKLTAASTAIVLDSTADLPDAAGRFPNWRVVPLHVSGRVSGTLASAETAAAELGGGRVRVIDTETASGSIAMLALAIQRRLERGTTDGEVSEVVDRYRRERGLLFTAETPEFLLRGGRQRSLAELADWPLRPTTGRAGASRSPTGRRPSGPRSSSGSSANGGRGRSSSSWPRSAR